MDGPGEGARRIPDYFTGSWKYPLLAVAGVGW